MEPHEKKSIFHSSPPVEPWLCYYYQCFITINPPGDKSHCSRPALGDHNDVASHRGPQSESKQSAGVSRAAAHLGRKKDTTKPFENIWYHHQPLSANIL